MTWNTITALAQQYIVLLLGGFAILIVLLFLFCIVLLLKIRRERKRYDFFMGVNRRPDYNLETQMKEYFTRAKEIDEKYTNLLNMVTDMDKTMKSNVRKVGLVRYNPFQEMGGNLCFSLALLDGEDNGVVLNGIHSRTGSFTYAKPIEMGVSTYLLTEEELEAIRIAQQNAYEPEHEKVKKLKFKPLFKRRYTKTENKTEALGDVTEAEKAQIAAENAAADQIATDGACATLHAESAEPRDDIKQTHTTKTDTNHCPDTHKAEDMADMADATDTMDTMDTMDTNATKLAEHTDHIDSATDTEQTIQQTAHTKEIDTKSKDEAVDVTSPETQACFASLLSRSRKTEMEQAKADLPPMPQEEFTFPGILSEDLSSLPPTTPTASEYVAHTNLTEHAQPAHTENIENTENAEMPDIPFLDTVHPRKHRLMQQTKQTTHKNQTKDKENHNQKDWF